jgi:hypothetical protein
MIEPLAYHNAITILREINTTGHSPLEVVADNYKTYFIKSAENRNPSYYLISEFLCHYLLKCWRIPTPDIAAITLNPNLLTSDLSVRHKKHFYNQVCFGSQSIKDAIDLSAFFNIKQISSYRKFDDPEVLLKIALFDIWIENDDRKPTNNNIILQSIEGKFSILAIDHAYTFSSIDYPYLNPNLVSSSYNETILLSTIGQAVVVKLLNKNQDNMREWLRDARENFYLCISNCEKQFEEISSYVPKNLGFNLELQRCIQRFLFNEKRNKDVFTEFTMRLK